MSLSGRSPQMGAGDDDFDMRDDDSVSSATSLAGPVTPPQNIIPPSSELSPPDSRAAQQSGPRLHPEASSLSPLSGIGSSKIPASQNLNANGKRIRKDNGEKKATLAGGSLDGSLMDISNAGDTAATGNGKNGSKEGSAQIHQDSTGYSWKDDVDAPGYAWTNKHAREEFHRIWATVVDKDRMIKSRYGDVLMTTR